MPESSIWADLPTGIVLLSAGFLFFLARLSYVDWRSRTRLKKALLAEIEEIQPASDDDVVALRRRIENGEDPFIAVDMSYPVFDGHQHELSLLDQATLSAVVKTYTFDRVLSKSLLGFKDKQFQRMNIGEKGKVLDKFEELNKEFRRHRDDAKDRLSSFG